MIFDGEIVGYLHLTIPQSFCFAKIQPPLRKGAFFLSFRLQRQKGDFLAHKQKLKEQDNCAGADCDLEKSQIKVSGNHSEYESGNACY